MAKVRLELGAELDMLTQSELDDSIKRMGSWQREAAQGLRHTQLPVLRGTVANDGSLSIDGAQTEGQPYCGPQQGFYWKLERVSVSGLLAASTGITSVYKSGVQIAPTAGTAIADIAAASLPRGAYIVRVDAGYGANAESTTDFNMDLIGNGGAVIEGRLLVIAQSNTVRTFIFDQVLMDGASDLKVVAHANASVNSAYIAGITATLKTPGGTGDAVQLWKGGPNNRFVAWINQNPGVWQPSGPATVLKPGDTVSVTASGLATAPGAVVTVTGEAVSVPGPLMWKLLG